jgi:anti-sigma B factor antagonist
MEIHTSIDGQVAILRLVGRLTVGEEPGGLKKATADAVTGGATTVVLDLSKVPYIDSTRLGELIAAHVTVSRQGGRLVLAGSTARITDLLTVAGLEGIFEMFPSVDAAQAAFRG